MTISVFHRGKKITLDITTVFWERMLQLNEKLLHELIVLIHLANRSTRRTSRCRTARQGIRWVTWRLPGNRGGWGEEETVGAGRWVEDRRQHPGQGRSAWVGLSGPAWKYEFRVPGENSSWVWSSLHLKMPCASDFCSVFYLLMCRLLNLMTRLVFIPQWGKQEPQR